MFMGETIRSRIYQGNTQPLLPARAGLTHTHKMVKPTDISERLVVLMRMRGVSQYALATMSGVPQPTIQRIISGETQNPKIETLRKLGKALKATESLELKVTAGLADVEKIGTPIITWEKPEDLPEGEFVIVPRYDVHVAAGNGHVVYDELEHDQGQAYRTSSVRNLATKASNLMTVYAKGESMEPSIYEGDALLVDRGQTTVKDRQVYILRYGHEIRVKRLFLRPDGGLRIVSDNSSAFPEEVITGEEMKHIEIIGRVVERSGRM